MTVRDANGRFVKGHSGNPKGGSAKKWSASYLAAFNKTLTIADWKKIVKQAIAQAIEGDKDARRFLADYALGKPKQSLELSGESGGPLEICWINDWRNQAPDAT